LALAGANADPAISAPSASAPIVIVRSVLIETLPILIRPEQVASPHAKR
jgi:hypothetical protein